MKSISRSDPISVEEHDDTRIGRVSSMLASCIRAPSRPAVALNGACASLEVDVLCSQAEQMPRRSPERAPFKQAAPRTPTAWPPRATIERSTLAAAPADPVSVARPPDGAALGAHRPTTRATAEAVRSTRADPANAANSSFS